MDTFDASQDINRVVYSEIKIHKEVTKEDDDSGVLRDEQDEEV